MSLDARRLLESYYAAFNAGDWETFLGLLDNDVAHDINQGPRETGRERFAAFIARMNHCYRERIEDLVLFCSEDGRRGAAEFTVCGTYLEADEGLPPACGQTYRLPGGAFFEFSDGRISRISNYYNLQDWLRQVAPGPP